MNLKNILLIILIILIIIIIGIFNNIYAIKRCDYSDEVEVVGISKELKNIYLKNLYDNFIMDLGWEHLGDIEDIDYLKNFTRNTKSEHMNSSNINIISNYKNNTSNIFLYKNRTLKKLEEFNIDSQDKDIWSNSFREFNLYDEENSRPGWNSNWNEYFFKGKIYFAEIKSIFNLLYIPPNATYKIEYIDDETGEVLDYVEKSSYWMSKVREYPKSIKNYRAIKKEDEFYLKNEHNTFQFRYKPIENEESSFNLILKFKAENNNKVLEDEIIKFNLKEEKIINVKEIKDYIKELDLDDYDIIGIVDKNNLDLDNIELIPKTKEKIIYIKLKTKKNIDLKFRDIYNQSLDKGYYDRLLEGYYLGDNFNLGVDDIPKIEGYRFSHFIYNGEKLNEIDIHINSQNKSYKIILIYEEEDIEKKPEVSILPKEPDKDINYENEKESIEENTEQIKEKPKIIKHKRYLQGYSDNTIRGDDFIKRSEVAAILYRLSSYKSYLENKISKENYKDLTEDMWAYEYIQCLTDDGILEGYQDNTFRPNSYIKRSELAKIIVEYIEEDEYNYCNFKDISGHWSYGYIARLKKEGLVEGYMDGKFKPENFTTRAEFTVFINRLFNRKINSSNILDGNKIFNDLNKNSWYYEDIVEATNTHILLEERLEDGSEIWLGYINE